MPVHDWTRVKAGTFHDFHHSWITHLKEALNEGILPVGYYAQSEQHAGQAIPDILTFHESDTPRRGGGGGGIVLAEAPPATRLKVTADEGAMYHLLRRTVAIRSSVDDELVAFLEIISPSNKDRLQHVEDVVQKVLGALEKRVHVLVIDLLPPRKNDPYGIHGAVWQHFDADPYEPPEGQPLTLSSYLAEPIPVAYVEPVGVGDVLIDMPLFLDVDTCVNVPLESTYMATYRGVPDRWRVIIEGE
jgi:hypothetical protein